MRGADRVGMAAVLAFTLCAACGQSTPAAPTDPYAGRWTGTLVDDAGGSGTWEMTLVRRAVLSGSGSARLGAATVSGSVAELPVPPGGSGRFVSLNCSGSGGGVLVLNVSLTGSEMTGQFRSFGCPGFTAGAVRGGRD